MADDVTLPGTGTVVAADEIAGKKHQRIKVQFGGDGSATDVSDANPLPVRLKADDPGVAAIVDAIEAIPGGGGGGGAEYTEDDAAAANPAGGAVLLRRRDTLAAEASADGDWVAQNATNKGEAYVKDSDVASALADAVTELEGQSTDLAAIKAAVEDNDTPATVAQDAGVVRIGGVDYAPKFAAISASSSGDNPIITGVSGKKLRPLFWVLTRAADVNCKWRSGTTDITGLLYKGAAPGYSPVGHFETATGAALNLNLSAAVAVGGYVVYIEV